jgi:hypothetical protein
MAIDFNGTISKTKRIEMKIKTDVTKSQYLFMGLMTS